MDIPNSDLSSEPEDYHGFYSREVSIYIITVLLSTEK